MLPYNEAKKAVKILGIKTKREYYKKYKLRAGLPCDAYTYYKANGLGWVSWIDYLSHGEFMIPSHAKGDKRLPRLLHLHRQNLFQQNRAI